MEGVAWVVGFIVGYILSGLIMANSQESKVVDVEEIKQSQELCLESLPRNVECSQVWINNIKLERIVVEL